MSRASALARGRQAAEAGFVDACTIRRVTGYTEDPLSGTRTPAYLSPNPYAGPCRIKQVNALPETHDAGEDNVILSRLQVHVPVSVVGLEVDDEVTVTASSHDSDLPGRVFVIRGPAHGSFITARRYEVRERVDL